MTILVACGLQREAKLLVGPGFLVIPGGGDAARLEAMLEAQTAGAAIILSCGIGGALDPTLSAGDVVVSGSGHFADQLAASLPDAHYGTIIGQDHIAATAAEKAVLHAATGALAVDMESHIAARVAARHGRPFVAIRTISDIAAESLPPAALVGMNPDGSMALGKVLASLARQPRQLPALIRTGQHAALAFRSLAKTHRTLAPLWATLRTQSPGSGWRIAACKFPERDLRAERHAQGAAGRARLQN